MNDVAILVKDISKQYFIGKKQEKYQTLRDTLTDGFTAPFRRARNLLRGQASGAAEMHESIWALKDISFEVNRGELVGVIGRNGAGKSTLLKVLSRITEPTSGYAEIRGRVSSLLEVGTGFHLELTGRENVYLNGALLGMGRVEIDHKFDEIVAFSEVEKFIDTPVKYYSSGMKLRLAFAVAAYLEPEILIIDEVLAVGDARFQKKCINKMQDVGQQGRTVLFVSHNMAAITRLCERAILLDGGRIVADAASHTVVGTYLNSGLGTSAEREWPDPQKAPGSKAVRLIAARVRKEDGQVSEAQDIRCAVRLEMEYEVLSEGLLLMPYFAIFNEEGIKVFTSIDLDPDWRQQRRPVGHYVSTAWIPGNLLAEGMYYVSATMRSVDPMRRHFRERDVIAFQIIDSHDGDSARGDFTGTIPGVIRPLLKWETQYSPNGHRPSAVIAEATKR